MQQFQSWSVATIFRASRPLSPRSAIGYALLSKDSRAPLPIRARRCVSRWKRSAHRSSAFRKRRRLFLGSSKNFAKISLRFARVVLLRSEISWNWSRPCVRRRGSCRWFGVRGLALPRRGNVLKKRCVKALRSSERHFAAGKWVKYRRAHFRKSGVRRRRGGAR